MSRDWSKEPWRKLYRRESPDAWCSPWLLRCIRDNLLRYADDDGILVSKQADPIGAVLRHAGAHADELEVGRRHIQALIDDEYLALEGRVLRIVNMPDAQETRGKAKIPLSAESAQPDSSEAQRRELKRQRDRERLRRLRAGDNLATSPATHGDIASDNPATSRGDKSDVSPPLSPHTPLTPQKEREEQREESRAEAQDVAREAATSCATTAATSRATGVATQASRTSDMSRVAAGALPTSLTEALELPIRQRAHCCLQSPERAQWLIPHQWPEVASLAKLVADCAGQPAIARLSAYERDGGVKQLVALLADFTPDELTEAIPRVVASPWWRPAGGKRGLSSLSVEVIRRGLDTSEADPAPIAVASNSVVQRHVARSQQLMADEAKQKLLASGGTQ